jgi:2-oxoglutarate dehydrogenase complex dehydrogenase (E1) component-like enzyme
LEEVYGKFSEFGKQIARSKIEEGINLDDKEWDTPFYVEHGSYLNDIAFFLKEKEVWTLREVREYCQKIYTGKIGVEFVHILS